MLPDYATLEQAIGHDWYALDPNLRATLDRLLPDGGDRAFAEEHVARFGSLVGGTLAARAEVTDKHGPRLEQFDRWGDPSDTVVHHPTWTANKDDLIAAGFVGLPYRADRPVPAVLTAALAYLVCQAETAAYCGLGMTAGAADIVERYAPTEVRDGILDRLTSLDPAEAWEGGMFLSEKQGGSDVGANTTTAIADGDEWVISGEKHYCSNVDAEVFIVLARPEGAPGGSRGLATFIVPRLLPDGSPNGFRIRRLKPKLGTVGVPTAEVVLDGARAWLAGGRGAATEVDEADGGIGDAARDGKGINRMMEMVNGSRFGVAIMGLGIHRRAFLEAAIYAARRRQWGNRIDTYPMVRETLVDLLVDLEASSALVFECAAAVRLAGDEVEGRRLRRLLIPLAKMRATRVAIGAASQSLEIFGGNGYMEDWPMARQLRDAQCHTIWEGTENILCLDVRRAMRSEGCHEVLFDRVERSLAAVGSSEALAPAASMLSSALGDARKAVDHLLASSDDLQLLHARRFAFLLADLAMGAGLLDEAAWSLARDGDARKAVVANRFGRRHLVAAPVRGILDDDRTPLDHFEAITRYGRIDAADIA